MGGVDWLTELLWDQLYKIHYTPSLNSQSIIPTPPLTWHKIIELDQNEAPSIHFSSPNRLMILLLSYLRTHDYNSLNHYNK